MKDFFILSKEKKFKLSILTLYVMVSSLLLYFIRPTYLLSIVIVLFPPAILNSYWVKSGSFRKILIFSTITTILFAPAVELMSVLANAWHVQSVIPRPIEYIPIENMIFAFVNFHWVLCFYEYFVDRDKKEVISQKFKYLVLLYVFFFFLVFTLYFIDKSLITLNYAIMAIPVLIVPATIIFLKNPRLLKKTFLPTLFFFYVFFVFEMVAIQIGNWWWPGEYVFPITVNGKIFPLDDVFIWYVISTPALIGGYEFFVDDFK